MRRRHAAAGLSRAGRCVESVPPPPALPPPVPLARTGITTTRLQLRPVDVHAARLVLAGGVPAGLELAPGYPSRFSLDLMSVAAHGISPHDVGPFFVVRRVDLAVVGEIGCRVDGITATAHVGYTIVEPCWNLGYASEALRGLLQHLLVEVGVPRVEAETLAEHTASRRVMEKAGMRVRGRHRGGEGGRPVELVSYEAVAGLWSARPEGTDALPVAARRPRVRSTVRS